MKTTVQNFHAQLKCFAGSGSLLIVIAFFLFAVEGCTTINPGEIGLKIVRGKLQPDLYTQGRHHSGFGTSYIKFNTRIKELAMKTTLPTKEGLEANTNLTLLYHLKPEAVRDIYMTLGPKYESEIILNNFAAIARETCLKYHAMDLMTQRDSLEKSILDNLKADIGHYGFMIDQVIVRDIDVPQEIDAAIEKKVLSEQLAKQQELDILTQKRTTEAQIEKQRKEMQFAAEKQKNEKESMIVLERMDEDYAVEKQKKEAERTIVEATAAKKSRDLENSTITQMSIKDKTVDVLKALANSPNTKIIITDGKTPLTLREPQ